MDAALKTLHREWRGQGYLDPDDDALPYALLIDPAVHDPLATEEPFKSMIRLPLRIGSIDKSRLPYLLVPSNADQADRALGASLDIAIKECEGDYDAEGARPRSVCAWVVRHGATEKEWLRTLFALSHRAWVTPPLPALRRVFRFWDPRVSTRLPKALGNDSWQGFLSTVGIGQWWSLSDDGALTRVGKPAVASGGELQATAWRTDESQWRRLRAVAWRNVIAQAALGWELPAIEQSVVDDVALRIVDHGLNDTLDVLRFAHLALSVHLHFDRHPQVSGCLETWRRSGSPPGGFSRRADQWDEAFLNLLRAGHWTVATALPNNAPH